MNNTLDDMQNGFAGDGGQDAEYLLKAMQAGHITGRETANQSLTQEPLKAESLEKTLKLLDHRTSDLKLINAMPKMTAYNTVEEFIQLESYGNQRGGFYGEGELSDVEDSKYVRRAEKIKYLQVTGSVTLQAQMVKSFVPAMAKEVSNKVMWIQRRANTFITKGNENIVPEEWNGLYAQHASIGTGSGFLYNNLDAYYGSEVVVDLRGKSLKQEDVEDGAVRVDANFGIPTHLFAAPVVISALAKDYYNDQRILMNGGGYDGVIGTVPKAISTTMGDITLGNDKFMAAEPAKLSSNTATSVKAPAAPVADASPALATDGSSVLEAGEDGPVFYAVSAINRYGESALTVQGAAVTLTVGSSVDLDFSAGVGSAFAATAFRVYRTKVNGANTGKFYPIFEVSAAELASGYDSAAPGLARDRHRLLPDCETAFLAEMTEEAMSFKQLAPVSKLDLAVVGLSRSFVAFLFATPQLYAPKKMVKFVNVGKTLN